jgi:hypothetical protein
MNHKNAVLQGLENMRQYDHRGDGLQYSVNSRNYTVDEMIEEIKNNTAVGNQFSQNVYDTVLTYTSKFSQDAE